MFHFNGFNMEFLDNGRSFQETYKCFPVAMLPGNEREDLERGGKIIMPPSALDVLTRHNVEYPMLFKLTNRAQKRTTHAGVLEFVAEEGKCYLPLWMMQNLLITEGSSVRIESVSLPVATFSKFQPQSTDFLDITNPKAVLENALRNFACLTKGDVIAIKYNKKVYELCVLETRPGDAVSIIECDMNVEFEAAIGYEPSKSKQEVQPLEESQDHVMEEVVETFKGSGVRLDGKKKKDNQLDAPVIKRALARGVPDYDYQFGYLKFDRSIKPISERVPKKGDEDDDPVSFHGQGFSMKSRKI
ncbi:PREDICTED: ubiquitin fusion degradation protein 1 homolog [Rhagoletis zephyria]|uniref:ubiquitin fusion degradation protein 1 homolog n=1 Tax=Rhagoletis zephyria TaxID=28612 RepID=UPI00081188E3|nr:PREDICTED: ubiquitin fusion degradation protein 1 homolog [Rhagoletis zephyria]XP_036326185.1 ubiquitin fusion degradation protein 1 homolog [Rhagoletis pomonella]